MLIKTLIFELCTGKYKNLGELAQAMGMPVHQIYEVQRGQRSIDEEFITGAIKAFPEYGMGHLFYFTT